MAAWAVSSAWMTSSSETSWAPASTITMPSSLPATTRSRRLCLRCGKVGLTMYWPSTSPTRTPAIVFSRRHLRERQRGGRAGEGEHVAVVVGIGRDHRRDDLRLEAPARREQRANRPVDDAARQRLFLGRLALALEEAARDAARGVGVLAIVDRQRQEIDAFAGTGRMTGGDEHHGVALADDDRTVGLLGQPAGLDGEGLLTDLNLALDHWKPRCRGHVPRTCRRDGPGPPHGAERGDRRRSCCCRADAGRTPAQWTRLLADAEPLDELRVAVGVLALQVVEQAPALADELQEAAA